MTPHVPPFDTLFTAALRSAGIPLRTLNAGECQSGSGHRCTLCAASHIDYEREAALKNIALQEFWRASNMSIPLAASVGSPLGRGYRMVTKRKVFHGRDGMRIGLIDPSEHGLRPFDALYCAIEPTDHAAIYATVRREIVKPRMAALAECLGYVIIKSADNEHVVIFNVREIGPGVVKAANDFSKLLSKTCRNVVATFVYQEESDGRYYLGTRRPRAQQSVRKLFGKSALSLSLAGKKFVYSPFSFSQVNHSILDRILDTATTLLAPSRERTLYDLYCGYGLFALSLADRFRNVIGVERSPESIDAARSNARGQNVRNVQFFRQDISAETLAKVLHGMRPNDAVILDPPRGGTTGGVTECVAAHRPSQALHIFCNVDLIPEETKRWESAGYRLVRAVPVDMFPGTSDVEMMLLFERT